MIMLKGCTVQIFNVRFEQLSLNLTRTFRLPNFPSIKFLDQNWIYDKCTTNAPYQFIRFIRDESRYKVII